MQTDLAPALARFGFDLHRRLAAGQEGNLVSSPYSVAVVLAMALAGARGGTATQLQGLLGDSGPRLAALQQSLTARSGTRKVGFDESVEVRLGTANRLWAQGGLRWSAEFLAALESEFGAAPAMADFRADPEAARRDINRWVAGRTRDRIPDLLGPGSLDPSTRLVLVNAIHCATPWVLPFWSRASRPSPFHRLDGTATEAVFMQGGGRVHAAGPGWAATELACHGGLGLLLVLPEPGRFAEVEASLDDRWLARLELRETVVHLALPSWTTRSAVDLTSALRSLGIPSVFGADADFSGMTTDEPIHASAVLQQTFLAVDEDGLEAAAASAMPMVAGGAAPPVPQPVPFVADRPFLYVLRDTESGAPLFIGRVMEPTVHETDS